MKVVAKPGARSIVGWLNHDETVTVLAVESAQTEGSRFLMWSTRQGVAVLFPAKDFEIKDGRLSATWVASVDASGFVYLAPCEWQVDGFWERYHDGDADAERIFAKMMDSLLKE